MPIRKALFIALVWSSTVVNADEKPLDKGAAKLLVDKAWDKVKQPKSKDSFSAELTPPLPAAWPPDGGGRLLYYAYARGFATGLVDGERIAAPWAIVHVEAGKLRLETLPGALRVLGTQGVHPVAANTFPSPAERTIAEELLAALTRGKVVGAPTAGIQKAYCSWSSGNGVIAAEIRGRHEAFFRWLACNRD